MKGSRYLCNVDSGIDHVITLTRPPPCYFYYTASGNSCGMRTGNDILYLLDQTLLSISRHSQIVAAPPDVLNEIVAALEY